MRCLHECWNTLFSSQTETCLSLWGEALCEDSALRLWICFSWSAPPAPHTHSSWAPWSSSVYVPACLDRLVDCSYLLLGAFSWLGHGTGSPLTDQTSHWTASFYLNRCCKTFYGGGTFSWWKSISAVLFHFIQTIFLRCDIKTVNMCVYKYIYICVCYREDDCLLRNTSCRFVFFPL